MPAIAVPSRARATTSRLCGRKRLHRRCRRALAGQGGHGRSARVHDTADLGYIGFSGDRAATTASKRRPLNLRHMREAAEDCCSRKVRPLALVI
jgi:hypothetical protein